MDEVVEKIKKIVGKKTWEEIEKIEEMETKMEKELEAEASKGEVRLRKK